MASSTAEYMALFRALESSTDSEARLFDDPYSQRFLRPSLRAVVRLSRSGLGRRLVLATLDRLWPGARASGIARTRFIDDELLRASREDHIEQVVVLGAGFDCRAHRQQKPAPLYLEVDMPETQARKRAGLHDRIGDGVRYVACNFEAGALPACLEEAGFRPELRSFFLWEGVTNYLSAEAVDDVLDYVSSTAPGSVLLFTYVDRLVLDEPQRFSRSGLLRSTLARSGEPWTFGLDPSGLAQFLAERGLRLTCDKGSIDYRAQYLGPRGAHLHGYEFYRAAIAQVQARTEQDQRRCE
jgi:methyltransferase (TIGR00027 family)